MGTVYKAEQASPRRAVALKVLRGANASAETLADFRQEAQTIAALEHPHIVPLYTFGEHDGAPYLALRFLDGGTVAQRIQRGPIDLNAAARWIASASDALDFAHGRGLVHRDIKPSNILLDESGNAYLADFGIAGATAMATSGPPTGSAAYMPPEQGRGEAVDGRGDIYSLAVTLFEMLTGQKPYTAETAFGVIVRHLNDPIPSARALNPNVPLAVDELIQWSMAKQPDERPQTASDFARHLKQALAHPNDSIRTITPSSLERRPAGAQSMEASPTLLGDATVVAHPGSPQINSIVWIVAGILITALCLGGLVVALSGGMLALLSSGTPTPIPTATELPTRTPLPSPTFAPTLTPDPEGGVLSENGVVTITARKKGGVWFSPQQLVDQTDVVIEARVRQISGPALNMMALVCRWRDETNYTALALSGDGTYSIWQNRDGIMNRLVDWSPASSIETGPGVEYRFRVSCVGDQLSLQVNGVDIGQAVDPNPISGDVAVMAGLREEGELIVVFDEVEVAAP